MHVSESIKLYHVFEVKYINKQNLESTHQEGCVWNAESIVVVKQSWVVATIVWLSFYFRPDSENLCIRLYKFYVMIRWLGYFVTREVWGLYEHVLRPIGERGKCVPSTNLSSGTSIIRANSPFIRKIPSTIC